MTATKTHGVLQYDTETFRAAKDREPGAEVVPGEGVVVLAPTDGRGDAVKVPGRMWDPSTLRAVIGAVIDQPVYVPERASRAWRYQRGETAEDWDRFIAEVEQAGAHWSATVVVELPPTFYTGV